MASTEPTCFLEEHPVKMKSHVLPVWIAYPELWESLDGDPVVFEVIRNMPIRQPLLWVDLP